MRVAYVCADSGIPLFGAKGASNHVREFLAALAAAGCRPAACVTRLCGPARPVPYEVTVLQTPPAPEGFAAHAGAEASSLARNMHSRQALEELHAQSPFEMVYERYSLWSYAGFEFAIAHNLPFLLEVNSPLRCEQRKYRHLCLEPAARAIELLLFRGAGLVIGVSRDVIDYVVAESGRHLPTMVLPNGVDLDRFRAPADAPHDGFTVGFVGSLKPWHGLEILLPAFRSLCAESGDYRLLLVGDGPMRGWVEDYTRNHGLEGKVHLTGAVEKAEVPGRLAAMDVAVAPYPPLEDFYFSPLKLFEYMAAGRAIVASRIGQIPAILRDRETALLAAPGDVRDLAGKIGALRAQPAVRARLGQGAREEAFRHHGWEHRVREVLQAARGQEAAAHAC